MISKPVRKVDKKLLEAVRKTPCVVTGKVPSDPHHVKSRKSGGPDTSWNVMPLNRRLHREAHRMGMHWMETAYEGVETWLAYNGWYWDDFGKLRNPKLNNGESV